MFHCIRYTNNFYKTYNLESRYTIENQSINNQILFLLSITGGRVSRASLGLPPDWATVHEWISSPFQFGLPFQPEISRKSTRWDGVDFSKKPNSDFWKDFPQRALPNQPSTRVNISALKKLARNVGSKFNIHQKESAQETILHLSKGAPAYQKDKLPGGLMRNASSARKYGAVFTQVLHDWLEEGFVAGPFMSPPLSEFRANSLMAVEQKGKVRPILNMSYPVGDSFNDNIDQISVPKVRMSSAKQFGQAILQAGKGALMSKMDMRDAYKHVPAKVEDLRLQGFQWLGAFFVETQQIFGASTAVSNFDNMASTILNLAMSNCSIPSNMVHRTLDDTACVAPAESGWCQEFSAAYKGTCKELNVKLAEDCKNREKAFTNETRGTVLGIQFDTEKLAWRISPTKSNEIITDIHTIINSGHVDLKQVETAAGRLNHFGQMVPFLQAFKRPLNNLLSAFKEDYSILREVPEELIGDLRVWAAVVSHANGWLPIPEDLVRPPMDALQFVSDAAGGLGGEEWAGVASLGFSESGNFWFLCRGEWPQAIFSKEDEKGAKFSSKMTTLELVGLLLPLLSIPEIVKGKNLILGVDNISVVFGWENRSVNGDLTASALIRAMHIVATFLETRIFVQHVPRLSSLASIMADNLTRASTAKADVWALVTETAQYPPPEPLWEWLSDPCVDWQLGLKLVNWLKSVK